MNDTYESLLDNIVQFNSDDMLCLPSANSIIELMALIHTLYNEVNYISRSQASSSGQFVLCETTCYFLSTNISSSVAPYIFFVTDIYGLI